MVQSRRISRVELAEIQALIQDHPLWSRWRLSRVLAQRWQWYAASGQLKDMAARTLLLKLHQRQLIRLPERRCQPVRRAPQVSSPDLLASLIPATLGADLPSLLPLQLRVVGSQQPDDQRFQRYLRQHHYLSYGGPVGENIGYLIGSCAGEDLACLLFGAPAWQCAPRDRWIGWSAKQRVQGLQFLANNSRFLILPWVQVRHLASHILCQIATRIAADWQKRYGHGLYLLETFVQQDRFRGDCYQAAHWIQAGQTTGRTRQDRHNRVQAPYKDVYLQPLSCDGHGQLCR